MYCSYLRTLQQWLHLLLAIWGLSIIVILFAYWSEPIIAHIGFGVFITVSLLVCSIYLHQGCCWKNLEPDFRIEVV